MTRRSDGLCVWTRTKTQEKQKAKPPEKQQKQKKEEKKKDREENAEPFVFYYSARSDGTSKVSFPLFFRP